MLKALSSSLSTAKANHPNQTETNRKSFEVSGQPERDKYKEEKVNVILIKSMDRFQFCAYQESSLKKGGRHVGYCCQASFSDKNAWATVRHSFRDRMRFLTSHKTVHSASEGDTSKTLTKHIHAHPSCFPLRKVNI